LKNPWTFKRRKEVSAHLNLEGPPETVLSTTDSDGPHAVNALEQIQTLADLPIGAHLILRCRKDWRDATLVALSPEHAILSVRSPNGRTYRLRRPLDSPLTLDGPIPLLGPAGSWRAGLARYDERW
jgi:hypothetical protein